MKMLWDQYHYLRFNSKQIIPCNTMSWFCHENVFFRMSKRCHRNVFIVYLFSGPKWQTLPCEEVLRWCGKSNQSYWKFPHLDWFGSDYSIKFTQHPILRPIFHDPPPPPMWATYLEATIGKVHLAFCHNLTAVTPSPNFPPCALRLPLCSSSLWLNPWIAPAVRRIITKPTEKFILQYLVCEMTVIESWQFLFYTIQFT